MLQHDSGPLLDAADHFAAGRRALSGGRPVADKMPKSGGPNALLEVLHRSYAAAGNPELWPWLLEGLCATVCSPTCVIASYDFRTHRGAIIKSVGIPEEYSRSYCQTFGAHDAWIKDRDELWQAGQVWPGRAVIAPEDLVETTFYKEWLRPQGLLHSLRGVLFQKGWNVGYVGFLRDTETGPFQKADICFLRQAIPHLSRSIEVHRQLEALRQERDLVRHSLDYLNVGVVLVGERGRIVALNQRAQSILESGDGLKLGRRGLYTGSNQGTRALRALIVRAFEASSGLGEGGDRMMVIPRASGRRPLSLSVLPLDTANGFAAHEAVAALFLVDPDRRPELERWQLRRLYGLTPSEANIATRLAEGSGPEKLAAALEISPNTIRTHLKRIFAKTGTHGQADLIRLLLMSAGPIRRPPSAGADRAADTIARGVPCMGDDAGSVTGLIPSSF